MVFLKSLKVHGFKSFAEPLTINFYDNMVGIVGPNGSGKSNINDALRWAMGEQSIKSLRGRKMHDVIFNGSDNWERLNFAEVTLTFDNSNQIFAIPQETIEVKRKIFRSSNNSEYYINNQLVQLKDVQVLSDSSGLTRSSLAVISQGQVTNFAAMTPTERRVFFDQTAGLNQYKNQKKATLARLVKAEANISRIKDIVTEIKRKLPTLERQSKAARLYESQRAELEEIEVSVLTKDITAAKQQLDTLNTAIAENSNKLRDTHAQISESEEQYNALSKTNYQLELEHADLTKQYQTIINYLGQAQAQEELAAKKINLLKSSQKATANDYKAEYSRLTGQLSQTKKALADLIAQRQKAESDIQAKRDLLKANQNDINKYQSQIYNLEQRFKQTKQSQINNRHHQAAVELDRQKNVIPGIKGLVGDLITFDKANALALKMAIGNRMHDVIINNTKNTKEAISFLKQNKLGQATFLPLDNIKERFLDEDKQFVLSQTTGFVAMANDLLECDKQFAAVKNYLAGQIIIATDYDAALRISHMFKQKFNVISLAGDWIKPFGAIQGGSQRKLANKASLPNANFAEEDFKQRIDKMYRLQAGVTNTQHRLQREISTAQTELLGITQHIGVYKYQIEQLNQKILTVSDEHTLLFGKSLEYDDKGDNQNLSNLQIKKNTLEQQLTTKQNIKLQNLAKLQDLEKTIRTLRELTLNLAQEKGRLTAAQIKTKNQLTTASNVLIRDYKMTYDFAVTQKTAEFKNEAAVREKIKTLRYDLAQIKTVNLDAIQEFEEENERYNFLFAEYTSLTESAKNLLKIVKKLDRTMIKTFRTFIEEVNQELPKTFEALFGGGTAKIFLEDEHNVLESGVEIEVALLGKKITHLNLLSGGEKTLIALSILFAVLKIKPLPLVVLDEVEATLDPSNVERFARYLKTFSEKTQFIIVTHRLGTMGHCKVLYGTTMQQKGVTKMVSIKLVDAKKMIGK